VPKYVITTPDGKQWDVEAPDAMTASKDLAAHRQELANTEKKQEIESAPPWKQALMGARDTAAVGADTLTAGFGTKALEYMFPEKEPAKDLNAMRANLGWVAPVADVAAMSRVPTAVPALVAKAGGGPAARWLTGTTAAGVESAVHGGLQAAGHQRTEPGGYESGEPAAGGAITGMLGGAAAHQLGGAINKGVNWVRGVDNSVPQGIRSKITVLPKGQKNPSAADKINVAANTAESTARKFDDPLAAQDRYKTHFEKLLREDAKSFNPSQRAIMERIVNEDPATKVSRGLGRVMSNQLVSAGAGAATGDVVKGALVAGGILGGGRALKEVSAQGTKEAVDDLRRLLAKKSRNEGPVSMLRRGQITGAGRQGTLEEYLYGDD